MEIFRLALQDLLEIEGFFSDDPTDRGGKTKYGITETTARAYGYEGDMKNLTLTMAEDIYYVNYWLAMRLEDISDTSPMVAKEMFDTGVNCGVSRAVKWFQKALNSLKSTPISVDGKIGPKTLRAFEDLDHITIIKMINVYQGLHYIQLCSKDKSQKKFIRGWFRRVLNY